MIHPTNGATRLRLLVSFVLVFTFTFNLWAQKPAPALNITPARPEAAIKSPADAAPVKAPENPAPVKNAARAVPTEPSADLVTLWATVVNNKHQVVTDLTPEDFALVENSAPREIESFSSEDVPMSIVIVYDNSGSTASWRAMEVAPSFQAFLDHSNLENEYSVITIGDGQARVSREIGPDAVSNAFAQLATEPANGSSPIYDVCYLALEALKQSAHEKRVLIVISDGEDARSRLAFKDLEALLKHSDVMVYSSAIVNPFYRSRRSPDAPGQEPLQKMAQATAGFSFTPTDKKELGIGWEYIAWELRHQYRIGFHPTPTTEKDHWSNVTVKLMAPSIGERRLPMSIRTKGGYFQPQLAAPAQP